MHLEHRVEVCKVLEGGAVELDHLRVVAGLPGLAALAEELLTALLKLGANNIVNESSFIRCFKRYATCT